MTEFFPGSRQVIAPPAGIPDTVQIPPEFGRTFRIGGSEMRLFSLGELSELLNRRPVTLRKWERDGHLPKPTFVRPGANGDPRGRRRYYSKAQVEALVRIAAEEGILQDHNAHISKTLFPQKALAAFKQLAGRHE